MASTHTPGPWLVVGTPRDHEGDAYVAIQTPAGAFDLIAPGVMRDRHAANARLIAAAPDLLAALRACVACGALERSGADANAANAAVRARAAIAKAEAR